MRPGAVAGPARDEGFGGVQMSWPSPEQPQDQASAGWWASEGPLVERHDALLLDLDGVVYTGAEAVPHAVTSLLSARARGLRLVFVTNNASRTPQTVAAHLSRLGLAVEAGDVVTSAQAAATVVAARVPRGSAVLLVGGEGLDQALREHHLVPVQRAEDSPAAVVQGFAPSTTWQMLMEACVALRSGVPWIVSNTDRTFPTARGMGPGNGALVEVVSGVIGAQPDEVAGKPFLPIMREAQGRAGGRAPLVVGDRLDTDIEGARRAGLPSLLVLTGVTDVLDLLACAPSRRPTYLAADLRALQHGIIAPSTDGSEWLCGRARARVSDDGLLDAGWVAPHGRGRDDEPSRDTVVDMLRAASAAVWQRRDEHTCGSSNPADRGSESRSPVDLRQAAQALSRWTVPHGWDRGGTGSV